MFLNRNHWRFWAFAGAQIMGEGVGLPCSFLKIEKNALIVEKMLFLCIYGLGSHWKCIFKSILEKNTQVFPCTDLLLYVVHEMFYQSAPVPRNRPLPKNSWLRACNIKKNKISSKKMTYRKKRDFQTSYFNFLKI